MGPNRYISFRFGRFGLLGVAACWSVAVAESGREQRGNTIGNKDENGCYTP